MVLPNVDVHIHQLENGLTLLVEQIPHVRSASFSISLQAGCAYEPANRRGLAGIVLDLMTRGAGPRNNRELNQALDALGVDRSETAGVMRLEFSASMLARDLPRALELYADIIRRPHLSERELEPVRNQALQDLESLADDPPGRLLVELRRCYFPEPISRDSRGDVEGVRSVTIDDVREYWKKFFRPRDAIVSIAGNVDWLHLRDQVEELFGDWPSESIPALNIEETPPRSRHIQEEVDQTQIGIAYPSVTMDHPEYYAARGAVGVLSDGMSSRLFTNVREAYGLCYAIRATLGLFKDRGAVVCYTAGEPHNAQELLNRTLHEIRRLPEGVEEDELDRVKAGLKSALIMKLESTAARAAANSSDWYLLGRVRTLNEIQSAIDSLTPQAIVEHLRRHPPKNFTIVTLGPQPLQWNND